MATVVIAIFTVSLSRSTKKLWLEANSSGETALTAAEGITGVSRAMQSNVELLASTVETNQGIARHQKLAMEYQLRAYVFPIDLRYLYEAIPGTNPVMYGWRFAPVWRNSGATPTKNLEIQTFGHWRYAAGNEITLEGSEPAHGLIPPGLVLQGGQAPQAIGGALTPNDLTAMQTGERAFILSGYAHYNDVFEGTPQHVTRFRWIIICSGDPHTFVPDSKAPGERLDFRYILDNTGNNADDQVPV